MGSHACHIQRPGLNPQRELERKKERKEVLFKPIDERRLLPTGENSEKKHKESTTQVLALFHRPYLFSSHTAIKEVS